jgi:hypothetical protein
MGFASVQGCSLALPLVVHLFEPRQVAQPSVVIFVELRVSDVFFFHPRKLAPRLSRAMLLPPSLQSAICVTSA